MIRTALLALALAGCAETVPVITPPTYAPAPRQEAPVVLTQPTPAPTAPPAQAAQEDTIRAMLAYQQTIRPPERAPLPRPERCTDADDERYRAELATYEAHQSELGAWAAKNCRWVTDASAVETIQRNGGWLTRHPQRQECGTDPKMLSYSGEQPPTRSCL